jgi:hypothetical protein
MNLPLQMGAVFRGRPALLSMSRSRFASGRVLPASNYCGTDASTGLPNITCRCASDYQEYKCVGPSDSCGDCGHTQNHP